MEKYILHCKSKCWHRRQRRNIGMLQTFWNLINKNQERELKITSCKLSMKQSILIFPYFTEYTCLQKLLIALQCDQTSRTKKHKIISASRTRWRGHYWFFLQPAISFNQFRLFLLVCYLFKHILKFIMLNHLFQNFII